jgi:hypothetical protein
LYNNRTVGLKALRKIMDLQRSICDSNLTGYGLEGRGVGVDSRLEQDFSSLHIFQTGSGAHPASYIMGTAALSERVKLPAREADHSSPTSAEIICGSVHPLLGTSSWRSV